MKIKVKPIPRKPWHKYTGKNSFTKTHKIQALVDPETMKYATGLSAEDIEHLKKMGITYDLSDTFKDNEAHPFWDSTMAAFKLENATMILDDTKPMDFIKIKMMKASKYVANSNKEWNEGKWAEATHVIYDEEEEVKIQATKVEIKNKAIIEASKLRPEKKVHIILLILGKNLKGHSNEFIEVGMAEAIDEHPEDVLSLIQEKGDKELAVEALVLECLSKSILRKKGHKILYHEHPLGIDVGDVTEYLLKDENNDLKIRLLEAVKTN